MPGRFISSFRSGGNSFHKNQVLGLRETVCCSRGSPGMGVYCGMREALDDGTLQVHASTIQLFENQTECMFEFASE
ncbi:hypothetical protein MUK42_30576, partial [Musa troglodytarum]